MSAHADEIRDAEILELQRRVKSLEERVEDVQRRPMCPYNPWNPPSVPPMQPPYQPIPSYPYPDWTYRPYSYPIVWC